MNQRTRMKRRTARLMRENNVRAHFNRHRTNWPMLARAERKRFRAEQRELAHKRHLMRQMLHQYDDANRRYAIAILNPIAAAIRSATASLNATAAALDRLNTATGNLPVLRNLNPGYFATLTW